MLSAGVNFFGHAAVASWHADDGGWLLGAMLPDFASMIGARLDAQPNPRLAAGVAHHHATDAAFHHAPAVVGLMRDAEARLTARGVRRGPTRAVAHVGVELLLDGVLTRDAGYRASFATGLAHSGPVAWTDGDGDLRFAPAAACARRRRPPISIAAPAWRVGSIASSGTGRGWRRRRPSARRSSTCSTRWPRGSRSRPRRCSPRCERRCRRGEPPRAVRPRHPKSGGTERRVTSCGAQPASARGSSLKLRWLVDQDRPAGRGRARPRSTARRDAQHVERAVHLLRVREGQQNGTDQVELRAAVGAEPRAHVGALERVVAQVDPVAREVVGGPVEVGVRAESTDTVAAAPPVAAYTVNAPV